MVRLESILDSWKGIREDTAQAMEDFSAHDLDYQPSAALMGFGDMARHILQASHALTGMLLDGVDYLATPQFRELINKYVAQLPAGEGTGALARELRNLMNTRAAQLAAQPASLYSVAITRFDEQRVTRLQMLPMSKDHESTHRSQLFLYLRLKGIVPPTTPRRQPKANA
jgi:uncharacterized damage-inducible protein DinB